MANGNGLGWIETVSKLITQVGFPIVVAGFLLWWVMFRFENSLDTIAYRLEHNADVAAQLVQASADANKLMASEIDELRRQTTALEYLANKIRERDGK